MFEESEVRSLAEEFDDREVGNHLDVSEEEVKEILDELGFKRLKDFQEHDDSIGSELPSSIS